MSDRIDERVYFAQADDGGPIKIGVSRDPKRRARQLGRGVGIVASLPGNREMEQLFHRFFRRGRLDGEWFSEDTPGLAEFVEAALVLGIAWDNFQARLQDVVNLNRAARTKTKAAA